MSLAKGRFGIEYNPRPRKEGSSGVGWLVGFIVFIAAIYFIIHRGHEKTKVGPTEEELALAALSEANAQPAPPPPKPKKEVPPIAIATNSIPMPSNMSKSNRTEYVSRPTGVKNRLLRLEEAEKAGNIEMAISTIEELRNLAGQPAADLDDMLARRAGEINIHWLFNVGNRQWIKEVTVRPGDSATRIASANGSTLASLVRLNNLKDANHIRPGQTLRVMNHPHFSMVVHKRARYADLNLDGKFFKRYDLMEDVTGKVGAYRLQPHAQLRNLLSSVGVVLSITDRVELETLVPAGSALLISET